MKKLRHILLILMCLIAISAEAQVSVRATLDSTELVIGEQTHLRFELTQNRRMRVQFPPLYDSLVSGVEVVGSPKFDTVKLDDGKIQINADVLITSFDTALYYIPPFKFAVGSDTFRSNPLSLRVVQPFEVDTVSWQVRDIKPVYDPKMNWLLVIAVALGILLLGAAVAYLIFTFNKKRKIKQAEKQAAAIITPAQAVEIALRELERIRHEKLWQSAREKEYHTDITNVLRQYIEHRYEIDALEMTSEQILEKLSLENTTQSKLRQILQLADLVKFAKWKPMFEEHDLSLKNAMAFVYDTAPKAEEPVESAEEKNNDKI